MLLSIYLECAATGTLLRSDDLCSKLAGRDIEAAGLQALLTGFNTQLDVEHAGEAS